MQDLDLLIKKAMVIGSLDGIYAQLTLISLEDKYSISADLDKVMILIDTMREQLHQEIIDDVEEEDEDSFADDYDEKDNLH